MIRALGELHLRTKLEKLTQAYKLEVMIKAQVNSPAGMVLKDAAERAGGTFTFADNLDAFEQSIKRHGGGYCK